MRKGVGGPSGIVHRLAERKIEMKAVLVGQVRRLERLLHRAQVGTVELDGLEVRQTPPGVAQRRLELDGATIGGNRFSLPAQRLEHVTIA